MKDNDSGRKAAAITHLNVIRARQEALDEQAAIYVKLAYAYGLGVAEIAKCTDLSRERVRALLLR